MKQRYMVKYEDAAKVNVQLEREGGRCHGTVVNGYLYGLGCPHSDNCFEFCPFSDCRYEGGAMGMPVTWRGKLTK